jgi:hypothetical protein
VIVAILVAEAAFWIFLLGGLALRYLMKARRLSTVALAAVPLVDVVLVVLIASDAAQGAEPTQAHALATIYLGVTVAFGHPIIRRTDAWFRYRFVGGPKPIKPPKGSTAEVRALWREWLRVVVSALIAAACLLGMIALEGGHLPRSIADVADHPYWAALMLIAFIVAVWFLAGPAFAGRGRPAPVSHPTSNEPSEHARARR